MTKELSEEQIAELYSKHEQIQKAVKDWSDNWACNEVEESYNDGALDGAYIGFKHGIKKGFELGQQDWKRIESVPSFTWVQLYSPDYEKGPGKEKQGIMQGCYRPRSETLDAEFIDDFGVAVNWAFTHWKPLPEPPRSEEGQ
jgi:hypothetical protein